VIDIPGYVIKREIGSGGMASVHLAVQTSLEREVALKVMSPSLASDPTFSKRFLQEARMLASLAHPNIVAVYDVGVTPGQLHYFSMQYLPGGDFASRVQHGMEERDLTLTLAGVARALGYAHQRGYVHRDVAPGNILYDTNGNPVLTDFGIALTAAPGSRITSAGFSVGTSHYMSPEQARGGDVDQRSDIYSLGVLCYFGLTGKPPFDGADGFAVAYAHVFEPIPRLPAEKAYWQDLIDRALAKDPKDRYADVEAFLDGLAAVVPQYAALFREESPPPAPPPPVPASAATVSAMPAVSRPNANGEAATRAMPRAAPAPVENATMMRPRPTTAPTPPAPAAPTPPVVAPAPVASATPNRSWMRVWPLLIVLIGIGLIAFALLTRPGKQNPPKPVPVVVAPATETPAPVASTAEVAANPAPAAATVPGSANPAPAPAAETAMDSVEAADAQASVATEELPTVVDPVVEAVRLGRIDLSAQRLTLPAGSNALERFALALKLDPKNKAARQGIVDVAKKYIELAEKSRAAGDLGKWDQYLKSAVDVAKTVPDDDEAVKLVAANRQSVAAPFVAQGKTAAAAWDKAAARTAYEKALQLDPNNEAAREGLKFAATIGEPGFVFHDKIGDGQGPELVIIDAHVAMARHDVTRADFRRYWSAAGHSEFADANFSCRDRESVFRSSKKRSWENPDIAQDDNHPVVCVSWQEAAAYAQWLSKQTGKHYRLATPAEFDAVARRASNGACKANLADASFNHQYDSHDGSDCDDGFATTAPVGHFPATAGVSDIDGNVRVWVAACGNGAAAEAGSHCRDFMVKGRGWLSVAAKEPPTFQDTYGADVALNSVGIRVVRDLDK